MEHKPVKIVVEDLPQIHTVKPVEVLAWFKPYGRVELIDVHKKMIFIAFTEQESADNAVTEEHGVTIFNGVATVRPAEEWDRFVAGEQFVSYEVPSDIRKSSVELVADMRRESKFLTPLEMKELYERLEAMRAELGAKVVDVEMPPVTEYEVFQWTNEAIHQAVDQLRDIEFNCDRYPGPEAFHEVEIARAYLFAQLRAAANHWLNKIDDEMHEINDWVLPSRPPRN